MNKEIEVDFSACKTSARRTRLLRCAYCSCLDHEDNPVLNGICGQCECQARNGLRRKLQEMLGNPTNFTRAEWNIIFDAKSKILNGW